MGLLCVARILTPASAVGCTIPRLCGAVRRRRRRRTVWRRRRTVRWRRRTVRRRRRTVAVPVAIAAAAAVATTLARAGAACVPTTARGDTAAAMRAWATAPLPFVDSPVQANIFCRTGERGAQGVRTATTRISRSCIRWNGKEHGNHECHHLLAANVADKCGRRVGAATEEYSRARHLFHCVPKALHEI